MRFRGDAGAFAHRYKLNTPFCVSTVCDNSGAVVQTLRIEDTATLELTVAGGLQKLMSALEAFRGHPHVPLVSAVLNQP